MSAPETHVFAGDGRFPNAKLPLLVYRAALPADADAMERRFAANDWRGAWRNGIYNFHHFHSNAHEVLGVARGSARVCFGGPQGAVLAVTAGDVIVIPAGVAHRNVGADADLLIVGAYPGGAGFDLCRGDPADYAAVLRRIAAVALPDSDPVEGREGSLRRLWS